jgi:hypothetical protein
MTDLCGEEEGRVDDTGYSTQYSQGRVKGGGHIQPGIEKALRSGNDK